MHSHPSGAPRSSFRKPVPLTERAKRAGKPPRGMILFFGVFALVGGIFTYIIGILPVLQVMKAKSWMQVPCTVISSNVGSHRGDKGYTYSIDIDYNYEVNGQTYSSSRYSFVTGSSSGYDGKAAVVAEFPPGQETSCYVDPKNPAEAVLNRDLRGEMAFGFLPLIFFAIGAGGIVWVLRANSRPDTAPLTDRRAVTHAPLMTVPVGGAAAAVPGVLKPRGTRFAAFVGLSIFGLLWNGIVSVFVIQIVQSWRRGSPSWFETIFMIPFVLVGLGFIAGALYQLLAMFNPSTEVQLDDETPRLGEKIKISWTLSGKVSRVQRLEVLVEGREEATYRRGTNTRTDRSVFFRETLADTRDPGAMTAGSASFKIPSDTMHSFTARNNKIVWCIKLKGDIPRWPDIQDEYPLQVAPQAPKGVST